MELEHLRLVNFRNFEQLQLPIESRCVVFHGRNGQGKTNLLEAIHYLGTLKPIRSIGKIDEVIRWNTDAAKVSARCSVKGVPRDLAIEFYPGKKTLLVNDKRTTKPLQFLDGFRLVSFSPVDLQLVRGAPELRRAFFDRAVFNVDPGHLERMNKYKRVLRQRNQLLKDLWQERDRLQRELGAWDPTFFRLTAEIRAARMAYLQRLDSLLPEIIAHIATEGEIATTLAYVIDDTARDDLGEINVDHLESEAAEAGRAAFQADMRRGRSTTGAHRDDIGVYLDGQPARKFASQGEQRTIVLGMKIAESEIVRNSWHESPIFCLDDISSELDRWRREALFDYINRESAQVFVTTASLDAVTPLLNVPHECLEIKQGNVEKTEKIQYITSFPATENR
jgi:DNA replication and repair protein RecF